MSNTNGNAGLDKTNINWLITVYSNFWRNPLFIRTCED